MKLLKKGQFKIIADLFNKAKKSIKIISPFISEGMTNFLCNYPQKGIKCSFITRIYVNDLLQHANSLDCIKQMLNSRIDVYSIIGLHTKLYIFDDRYCVLGSANFTNGGMKNNIELSILLDGEDDDEAIIIRDSIDYFNNLVDEVKQQENGIVTLDKIDFYNNEYKKHIQVKKYIGDRWATGMFGGCVYEESKIDISDADEIVREIKESNETIKRLEDDWIYDAFSKQCDKGLLNLDNTVWLKFHGTGNDRYPQDSFFVPTEVEKEGKKIYITCYPDDKIPSVETDDYIYTAVLTWDNNNMPCPMIVGKGRAACKPDRVEQSWIKQYNWMEGYPLYVIMKECSVVETKVVNGISLHEIWDKFGSDTYISSFGKNEELFEVAQKHLQKAHIRLTGNAKQYIDKRLEELFQKYGKKDYKSES